MTFCKTLKGWLDGQKAFQNNDFLMPPNVAQKVAEALSKVFKHEIDPSMGPVDVQVALDTIHHQDTKPPIDDNDSGLVFRC